MKDDVSAQIPYYIRNFQKVLAAKRCGAKSKRHGKPCSQPAMKNGRCRFHGGKSTGPKTPEGKARAGNWKHGLRSRAYREQRQQARKQMQVLSKLLGAITSDVDPDRVVDLLAEREAITPDTDTKGHSPDGNGCLSQER